MRKFVQKFSREIIASTLLFSLIFPNVANAQLITTDPLLLGQTILGYIGNLLKVVVKNVVVVGAVQVSQKVAKDAAESIATWVWEGGSGKNPLTYMKNPGDYIKDQVSGALSDALDSLTSELANADLLCISDPLPSLGVLTGLHASLSGDIYQPKAFGMPGLDSPKCQVGSIVLNYRKLTSELPPDQLLKQFSNAITNGGSEVDQIVGSQFETLASLVTAQKAAELERMATKSYKDQTAAISGAVVQTSADVMEDSKLNTAKFQQEQESRQLAGILASGAESIPAIFATTFANAISKKIIEKLKRGKGTRPASTLASVNLANVFGSGKSAGNSNAGALYSDVKTAVISEGNLDLLTNFSACPDKFSGPDNCVIDEGFASAIRTADAGVGKALTVKEALEQDKLHAQWELVPASKKSLNEDRLCSKGAYCFSNLAKLRKARVIPIGWEIAAAVSDGTGRITFGDVVKGFNDCAYNRCAESGAACTKDTECNTGAKEVCVLGPSRTKDKPFCHLIDPNWVLKMPEQICRAQVFGPQPQSSLGADRQEVCSDQASCLQEDSTGQCTGAFGYCLREKNTFRFEADQCPVQFAGCRTYGNKEFGDISLIDSTINSGSCTDKNTGCMGYYADYAATGAFDLAAPKVYLNGQATSCNIQNIGCTEVQNAVSGKQQFLRLPPAGLGCKGYSNDSYLCSQYASACTVDEVGCEVYQPVGSSDPTIPGVITSATRDVSGNVVAWNDECTAECVGYASYYQEATRIEPLAAPATAFIPQSATMCTQDAVGCDAYQNIDTAAKGAGATAYFAEPQKCSDPEVDENHAIFYSWEGSDQSGYQLHQHDLVKELDGVAPRYDVPGLMAIAKECDAAIYKGRVIEDGKPNPLFNTDCRELFDKDGKPFYRLLSKTLPSTPECVAFRKDKADEANCKASNGKYDTASGSCEYGFLPSASSQCKAEQVGCRAFDGSAALSPKIVLNESFDSVDGWTGGELSNEGITVGDSVLKLSGTSAYHALAVTQNKTYNIVFWAKGQGTINLTFNSKTTAVTQLNSNPLTIGPEWRRFEVSSPPSAWSDDAATLAFVKTGGALYIENVVVKEQTDVVYAVKDSWVTPLSCDAIPGDNIPGPALNCRAYKPKSQSSIPQVYLTGFTNLCRAQSAGCQKFVSSQNTQEITARDVSFGTAKRTIPADAFVYVIANNAASCPAEQKGCSALGVSINDKTETILKINNPESYDASSCEVKDEWCQTFTGAGGTQRFFKYPDVAKQCEYREDVEIEGSKFTGWFKKGESKPKPCYDSFVSGGNHYGIYKNQDANFNVAVVGGMAGMCEPEFNQCTEFVDHADISRENPAGQPYYFMKNDRLDVSSCNGKVSLKEGCVLLENTDAISETTFSTLATYCKSDPKMDPGCSEILKNSSVSSDNQSKDGISVSPVSGASGAFNALMGIDCKKAQINGLFVTTDCDAQLSKLKMSISGLTATKYQLLGCIKDNPEKIKEVQAAVDVVQSACAALADANTIVKVRRDRTCAEWLSCKSSISVYDKGTQKYKDVCSDLGVCNKLSTDSGAVGRCANWVTPQQFANNPKENLQRSLPLTTARYVDRNVGWYGQEFSGYSLWHKFQPDTVGRFKENEDDLGDPQIGVGFKSETCIPINSTKKVTDCKATVFNDPATKTLIENEFGAVSLFGKCFEQKCWYPIDGFTTIANPDSVTYTQSSCRGYPEIDSPFPQSVASGQNNIFGVVSGKNPGFDSVNVCDQYRYLKPTRTKEAQWKTFDDYKTSEGNEPGLFYSVKNGSCDCSYKKIEYGDLSEKHYYSVVPLVKKTKEEKVLIEPEAGTQLWRFASVVSSNENAYIVSTIINSASKELTLTPAGVAFYNGDKINLSLNDKVVARMTKGLDATDGLDKWYGATIKSIINADSFVVLFDNGVPEGAAYKESMLALVTELNQETSLNYEKNDKIPAIQLKIAALIKAGNLLTVKAADIAVFPVKTTSDLFTSTPKGICGGGWFVTGKKAGDIVNATSKKGLICSSDFDCIDERLMKLKNLKTAADPKSKDLPFIEFQYSNDDGTCEFKKKESMVNGWKGYCLEKDLSAHLNNNLDERPCLTWLPIDIAGVDIYNQYTKAQFNPRPTGEGQYYCAVNKGLMKKDSSISNLKDAYTHTIDNIKYTIPDKVNAVTITEPNKPALFNGLYAKDIDYIELVASDGNSFFPVGYKMHINDDGIVRIYTLGSYPAQINKNIDANKELNIVNAMRCPAYSTDGAAHGYYDFLNPQELANQQGSNLSILSMFARRNQSSSFFAPTDGNVDDYFQCFKGGEGESKSQSNPVGELLLHQTLAITGIRRAVTGKVTDLGERWFVRLDTQNKTEPSTFLTSGDCPTLDPYSVRAFYELSFNFDSKTGQYQNLAMKACHGSNQWHTFHWSVTVHLRDSCKNIIQTVKEGESKAYTQRIWTGYPTDTEYKKVLENGFEEAPDGGSALKVGADAYVRENQQLFGSFKLNQTPVDRLYTYLDPDNAEKTGRNFGTAQGGGAYGLSCPDGMTCLPKLDGNIVAHSDLQTPNNLDTISNLFAQTYGQYKLDEGSGLYSLLKEPEKSINKTADGAKTPPVLFAFDPATCSGARGGTCQLTRKYGMTINGEYGDGATVFDQGMVAATMQFYGYADQNQMPLKRITVDWNDGSNVLQKKGIYRNHKPVCATPQMPVAVCKNNANVSDYNHVCVTNQDCVDSKGKVPDGTTCDTAKGNLKWSFGSWGGDGSPEDGACEPNFFQFAHAYTFTPDCGGVVGALHKATPATIAEFKLEGKVGIDERFCVFKPRVQLLDNWGACNGDISKDASKGYAGKIIGGNNGFKCDQNDTDPIYYTPFQGNIIVKE